MYSSEQETEIENNANRHLGKKKLASCFIENYCQAWKNMKTGLEIHSEVDGTDFHFANEYPHKVFLMYVL